MTGKALKVAAIQLRCDPGQREANLARAGELISRAVAEGASMVLLPELTPGGYELTEAIWDSAETISGPSVAWLKATAAHHGIHLGMSFLEADAQDFFNSFVIATPQGELAGRVRKNPPASAEAYFFRPGNDSHYIDTSIGRLGVCICYEALLFERLKEQFTDRVDLLLIPMSAGTPTPRFPLRKRDAAAFDANIKGLPAHHARALGIPVVMANKCGPLVTAMPGALPDQDTSFPGLSAVVDGEGLVRSQLGAEQGLAVGVVTLDPARKARVLARSHGRWALAVPWFSFSYSVAAVIGARAYARNDRRIRRAETIVLEERRA